MRYAFVCCLCLCVLLCLSVFVRFGCDSSCEVVCVFCVHVCDVLRDVVGFRFRACCVVFVRVCFATSVLMRVLVRLVYNLSCDGA